MKYLKNENGIALVIALMVLLALSVMAVGLMLSITSEQKITSNNVRAMEALTYAEAGIAEAVNRLDSDESGITIFPTTVNPVLDWRAMIINNAPPTLGTGWENLKIYETMQPDTSTFPYTLDTWANSSDTQKLLTIRYKSN